MALIDIPVSEPVRFEKLYGKSKLDIPGGIGQNNGTGSKVPPVSGKYEGTIHGSL